MEKVTKFDLQNAFKALDEIEFPKAVLRESVRKLPTASALVEEFYDIDNEEDIEKASADREDEIAKAKLAKIEKIVDLDAETPEDLEKSYSGKTIIQCPQCMTMFYKEPDDVIVSDDDPSTCNVGEKCQHCGNESGYTVVGKVAPVSDDELAKFDAAETPEPETGVDFDSEAAEEAPAEQQEEERPADEAPAEEKSSEEAEEEKKNESLTEEAHNEAAESKAEEQDNELRGADNAVVKCKVADVAAHSEDEKPVDCAGEEKPLEKPLTEDALPEPTDANVDKLLDSEEFQKPISEDEVERIFADAKKEEAEYDVEEIDDESVNECVSNFLKEVYENVAGFEMTDCGLTEGALTLDGKINFKSGNSNATRFVFAADGNHKLMEGYNDSFGNDTKFSVSCAVKDKKLYFESVGYKYAIGEKLVEGIAKRAK